MVRWACMRGLHSLRPKFCHFWAILPLSEALCAPAALCSAVTEAGRRRAVFTRPARVTFAPELPVAHPVLRASVRARAPGAIWARIARLAHALCPTVQRLPASAVPRAIGRATPQLAARSGEPSMHRHSPASHNPWAPHPFGHNRRPQSAPAQPASQAHCPDVALHIPCAVQPGGRPAHRSSRPTIRLRTHTARPVRRKGRAQQPSRSHLDRRADSSR